MLAWAMSLFAAEPAVGDRGVGAVRGRGGFPGGPVWRRPDPYSRWSIELRSGQVEGRPGSEDKRVKKVLLRQYGAAADAEFSQEIEYEDGERTQAWVSRRGIYHSRVGDSRIGFQALGRVGLGEVGGSRGGDRRTAPLGAAARSNGEMSEIRGPEWKNWRNFQEWEWIGVEWFDSVRTIGGDTVLVYVQVNPLLRAQWDSWRVPVNKVGPLGIPMAAGIKAAGVRLESRLPWILQDGLELRAYEFRQEAPGLMEFPEKVREFELDLRKAVRGALSESVRPY